MKLAKQLERRYYDPGVTPMPKNPWPKPKKVGAKKTPHLAVDSAQLRAAEMKRRRKAEKRNRDRAVIIGAPKREKRKKPWSLSKLRNLQARAAKALARKEAANASTR